MKFKKGDRVKVYGHVTKEYYSYAGTKGVVKGLDSSCLFVAFDGDDERLSHCCNADQVHRKQCRKLIKRKKSGAV